MIFLFWKVWRAEVRKSAEKGTNRMYLFVLQEKLWYNLFLQKV